jgi:hypothetical protein
MMTHPLMNKRITCLCGLLLTATMVVAQAKKERSTPTPANVANGAHEGSAAGQAKKTPKKRGPNPARWENVIKGFEASDAKMPPPKGAVLWIGGSNARRWKDVNDHFPNHEIFNRGFGGARLSDIVHYADRIILPYEPKAILVNAGGNDLGGGKSPEQILETARALIAKVRKSLPDTRICFNGLPSVHPKAVALHKLIAELTHSEENVVFIDLAPAFTDEDGKRSEFFVKDGIHFNDEGYGVLAGVMKGKF